MVMQRHLQRRGYDCQMMAGQLRRVRSLRTLLFHHKAKSSATVKHVQQSLAKENSATRNDLRNSSHLVRNLDLTQIANQRRRRTKRFVVHPHLPLQQRQASAHTNDPLRHNQLYQRRYLLCNRVGRENLRLVLIHQIDRNGIADPRLKAIRLEDHLYHTSHLLLDRADPHKEHWHLLLAPCLSEASVLIGMA